MGDRQPGDPPVDPMTERTDHAWLEAQVRELEATAESLLAQNRQLTQRVHFLRGEIDRLGRIIRVGGVVRNAVRDPGRLRLLRMDIVQALQPRPAPESPGPRPPDPATAAAAHRAVVLEAVDRRRRDGPPARPVADLRIGLVADPPLHGLLAGICTVVPLRPDDAPATIAAGALDLVLVESAWAGRDGSWRYRLAWHPHPRSVAQADLGALLSAAHAAGVPTAFWSTAARHDAGRFAAAARRFDHLFATDDAVLDRLARDPERRWVSAEQLLPGVRIDIHHPAGDPVDPRPVFIGSVPLALPLERREAIAALLAAAASRSLVVADRQAAGDPARFGIPALPAGIVPIRPATEAVVDLYRRHAAVLVPSLVAASGITVPARLLEALAAGAPVITTRSDAVAPLVGDLAVATDDPAELADALAAALDGPDVRHRVRAGAAALAWRHDIRRRVAVIARSAGIAVVEPAPPVEVLALADDPASLDALVAGLEGEVDATAAVVVGTTTWDAVRTSLPAALAAALPGRPVRVVAQTAHEPEAQRFRQLATVATGGRLAIVDPRGAAGMPRAAAGGLGGLIGCAEASGAEVVALSADDAGRTHDTIASVRAFPVLLSRSMLETHGWSSAPSALQGLIGSGSTVHAAAPAVATDEGSRP